MTLRDVRAIENNVLRELSESAKADFSAVGGNARKSIQGEHETLNHIGQ
jgi:hypothetical protein